MEVLEVGCSSGYRLNALRGKGCVCFGIDPSESAITEGKERYGDLELTVGVAHALPYPDKKFSLIYVPTVFYCIPREFLLHTYAEIDRVLADGGLLVIDDFFPKEPYRRTDRHAPGEYVYKQFYWEPYVASGTYTILERLPHRIGENRFDQALTGGDDESITVTLQKSLQGNYPTREHS
jgi:SAM-dependent methyltransferase